MRQFPYITTALSLGLSALLFTACDAVPGSENADAQEGVFVDAFVSGLRYVSQSKSGYTDAEGRFDYVPGETVSFFLGNFKLGESEGSNVVTPLHIAGAGATVTDPKVVNLLRFLQTLDDDGDPDNGIDLTRLSDITVDDADQFNLEEDSSLETLVSDLDNTKTLVSPAAAVAHFQHQIAELDIEFDTGSGNATPDGVEFRVIVGDNGLSGTWKVEYELEIDNGSGSFEAQPVTDGEMYGESIPLTAEDMTVSRLLDSLLDHVSDFDFTLASENQNVVEWQFATPVNITPAAQGKILLTKFSNTQPVLINTAAYSHNAVVWKKHTKVVECYVSPMGTRSCERTANNYVPISGNDIPTHATNVKQSYENSKLPESTLQTLRYQDTHHSVYFIPAVIEWVRRSPNGYDEFGGYFFEIYSDVYSFYKVDDYSDNIARYSNLQLSGNWELDYQYISHDLVINISNDENNIPVALVDVPTTLPDFKAALLAETGLALVDGMFWIPEVRMTEEHISWKVHIYSQGTNGRIGYIEVDMDYLKTN